MRKHELLSCLWLFGSLLKTEHMGKPWNNESAEKWWAYGRHVRQKELAPSAKVRRHPGVLDVRGRSDQFSRFDPRPERPHFSNFGPPTERMGGGVFVAQNRHTLTPKRVLTFEPGSMPVHRYES